MKRHMNALLLILLVFSTAIPSAYSQEASLETINAEVVKLCKEGQYARAEVLAKEAVQLAEKSNNIDYLSVADSLSILAAIYATQNKFDEAEPLFTRALTINEKNLGSEHPKVVAIRKCLTEIQKTKSQTSNVVSDIGAAVVKATIPIVIFGLVSLLIWAWRSSD